MRIIEAPQGFERFRATLARAMQDVGALMLALPDTVTMELCSECELRPSACVCDENAQTRRTTITRIMPTGGK